MAIDHQAIADRIQAILEANTTPQFLAVFCGEPLGLPLGGPFAAFWYLGRQPQIGTLRGQINVTERWAIACWWPRQPERATLEAWEVSIADADQALQTAFRADSQLNAASTTATSRFIDLTDSTVDYRSFPLGAQPGALYRGLNFEILLNNPEGEAITR